jgi:hypothetical protein
MIDTTPLATLQEQVGNFLDEQRHPPVRSATPSTTSFGSAFWAVSSPTMCRTC